MTVDEMLERMTAAEFMRWAAHFSMKGKKYQTPDEIRANLIRALGRKAKP
jgi:truncated hemoglobin YjbI